MEEGGREVPGGRENFFLNHPRNIRLVEALLLRAELVGGVADLVGVGDFFDAKHLQLVTAELGRLPLADILCRDQASKLLLIESVKSSAALVAINFDLDLLDELLEDLIIHVGEVLVQSLELDEVVVLLEEAIDVGLDATLDELLVLPALGVVHFDLGFLLANRVEVVNEADRQSLAASLVLVHHAEEIRAAVLMVVNRSSEHVVVEHSDASDVLLVDLAQKGNRLALLLQHCLTPRPNVVEPLRSERDGLVIVDVPPHLVRHPEVVNEERVLVDVLEKRELATLDRQLEAVLEVVVVRQYGLH